AADDAGAAGSEPSPEPEVRTFFAELPRFAFFEELAAATAAHGLRLDPRRDLRREPPTAGAPGRVPGSGSGATHATGIAGRLTAAERRTVLACLLTAAGLDYAERPKGLILFHRYAAGPRTAFEEHLVE